MCLGDYERLPCGAFGPRPDGLSRRRTARNILPFHERSTTSQNHCSKGTTMLFIVEEHSLLYGSDDKVVFHVSVTSVGPRNAMTQACGMKVLAGGRPFLYGSNELVEVHPERPQTGPITT
jgi:hypothetical protein